MRHLLLPLFLGSLDIISAIIAALVSIYLRFDGNLIPQNYLSMLVGQLPFFVMITIVSFFLFKLYSRVWRYAGSSELLAIAENAQAIFDAKNAMKNIDERDNIEVL